MRIAIHERAGSFSDRWIEYCKEQGIDFKVVNCYRAEIIQLLADCDALMWHHRHDLYEDTLFAKQLLYSVEQAGKTVFPDTRTGWHFDDKVGQKYLLESINAPLVSSYIFYDKRNALEWINSTTFPKVFKLRGGAGSSNVKLVETKKAAKLLVNRAFGRGFSQFDRLGYLKERVRKFRAGKENITSVAKGVGRLFIPTRFSKMKSREKGYVYFQNYIENNGFDVRVVVIGNKAVALKRLIRENDFRASGSGRLIFENESIDKKFIELAFQLSEALETQCSAFDMIQDLDSNVHVVEMSYCFPMLNFLDGASGFWTKDLEWHSEAFNLQAWMVDKVVHSVKLAESTLSGTKKSGSGRVCVT